MLLGRYNFDADIFDESVVDIDYDVTEECKRIFLPERKDLKILFRTIHGSKGLQADYVIILNTRSGSWGFPGREGLIKASQFAEIPEDFKNADERRLMYVALTKTKKKV